MLVFLPTDILVFLLLAMGVVVVCRIRAKEHLKRPWRKVIRHKTGMVSLLILATFSIIGLLDTIHFQPDKSLSQKQVQSVSESEPISLFDWWVGSLRTQQEKTYSAPFASYLYSKESVVSDDGSKRWAYARLKYAGLENPGASGYDLGHILKLGGRGLLKGILSAFLLLGLLMLIRVSRLKLGLKQSFSELISDQSEVPWLAILITSLVIICLGCTIAELSTQYHVFGTDKVGQDVLYQSLKSIRTGLVIGTLTTLVMLPFALTLGILAGFYRGWIDDLIQYLYTTLNSIPGVLLIAASILVVQVYMANHEELFASVAIRADVRLLFLCLILGITSWTGLCRLLRAETLKLREMEYVQAARALGVNHRAILIRHILPNLFHIVLISIVLDFSGLVLAEAVLSYINIGVDPSSNSWGNMINRARLEMAREPVVWWSLAAAFVFMFTLVLAANLFADAVRDAFDPRRAEKV